MPSAKRPSSGDDGLAGLAEEVVNLIAKPLDLVVLTREKLQATLEDAAERGRLTRADANELLAELVRRGRQQTDALFSDLADRARRTVNPDPDFPIEDYEELTVAQVSKHLPDLAPAQLRAVREFERRHANRKSVLAAIEKSLGSGALS